LPLIGRWAPDLDLRTTAGATRLAQLTRTGRPLLVDLTDDAVLAEATAPWRDRVDCVLAKSADRAVTALLLRPDCYVAWASAAPRPDRHELDQLRTALANWFGAPAVST